jgi:BCD family chlorophyll transporter-like MFS transporter
VVPSVPPRHNGTVLVRTSRSAFFTPNEEIASIEKSGPFSSIALARLCLVRFGASFLLILTTGILNRILISDLGMSAWVVTVVLSFQHLSNPLALGAGHLSDRRPIRGRRRVPYILLWTIVAAATVPFMPHVAMRMNEGLGWLIVGALLFGLFGYGLKVANVLVGALIADRTDDPLVRGRQLNIIWIMAIVGFITAGVLASWHLPTYDADNPDDLAQLQRLCIGVSIIAVVMAFLGTWGSERSSTHPSLAADAPQADQSSTLLGLLRGVMAAPGTRRVFVFLVVADFSFFIQEYVLESFGGDIFQMPVSVTTSFNTMLGLGMVISMLSVGFMGSIWERFPTRRVLRWGCGLGAASFLALSFSAFADTALALLISVFVLGVGKGLYNIGLAYLFMGMARSRSAGFLMGAWAAFGGFAVALGGLSGGIFLDLGRLIVDDTAQSYGVVFGIELIMMIVALLLVPRLSGDADSATA